MIAKILTLRGAARRAVLWIKVQNKVLFTLEVRQCDGLITGRRQGKVLDGFANRWCCHSMEFRVIATYLGSQLTSL